MRAVCSALGFRRESHAAIERYPLSALSTACELFNFQSVASRCPTRIITNHRPVFAPASLWLMCARKGHDITWAFIAKHMCFGRSAYAHGKHVDFLMGKTLSVSHIGTHISYHHQNHVCARIMFISPPAAVSNYLRAFTATHRLCDGCLCAYSVLKNHPGFSNDQLKHKL